jgi:putative flavoprotein involved in K+ transport
MSDGVSARQSTVVVIGAGPAGLAASKYLTDHGVDHVVLERGEVGHSWRTERWDSFRLLIPNWMNRLLSEAEAGDDLDGYMAAAELVDRLERSTSSTRPSSST